MLTLFTGLPGAGKTAAMLDLVNQQLKGRPVFVHFDEKERVRPEQKLLAETLKIPHTRVNAAEWHKVVPDGAVLLVDEAQGVWRARATGSAVPPAIQAFETHRHAGIDAYMTTQGPKLVDSNLRSLVGRHVHIRSTGWMGRWWYEWDQIQVNAETAWQKCTNKRRYVLPKSVFGLYVSANEHTKPIRKIPPLLYVLVALILGVIVLTWQFIASRSKSEAAPLPGTTAQGVKGSSHMEKQWIDDRIAFIPRVSNKPESAPAFDEIRRVVVMPVVAGGVCFKGVCRCVTQQGTDSGLSQQECKEWMERKPFDPYTAPPAPQKQAVTAPRADEQGRADRPLSSVPMPAGVPINVRADG